MLAFLQRTKTLKQLQQDVIKYILVLKHKYKNRLYASQNIFLDGFSNYSHINDKVDIVLSPRFYWVRKAILPVKSVRKAMTIVDDFFGDVLPEGDYKYKVVKNKDSFLLFAYEESIILDALKQSGINLSFINKIFFAQTEFTDFEIIDISDNDILYTKDDILVKLPKDIFSKDLESVDIKHAIRHMSKTSSYISIDAYENIIEAKTSQSVIFALSLIIVFYFSEYILIKQELSALVSKKNNIIRKYDIPSSTIVFDSIVKSLEGKKKKSIKSRESLYSMLNFPLKDGDYLQVATFSTSGSSKEFFIQILLSDIENATHYKDYYKEKFQIKSAKVDGSLLSIKGKE